MARNPRQGMNWCRLSTRLAIYHRDGFACVYCGTGSEYGIGMTLDHFEPCLQGGLNHPTNLVTCCRPCNSSKQDISWRVWRERLQQRGVDTAGLVKRVKRQLLRPIDRAEGRRLVKLRKPA